MSFARRAATPLVETDETILKSTAGIRRLGTPGPETAALGGYGKYCTVQQRKAY